MQIQPRAFLFDFDGLLIDSETAGLISWQEVYAAYGQTLDLEHWYAEITAGRGPCMPVEQLEQAVGGELPWDVLEPRRLARRNELIHARPGAEDLVLKAHKAGIPCAIVSNAPDWWVTEQAARTGIDQLPFEFILTKDPDRRSKPAPDSYLAALARLEMAPEEAVAFEDSPAGITAAVAAGVFCVAVPNDVTHNLELSHADQTLESLTECDASSFSLTRTSGAI